MNLSIRHGGKRSKAELSPLIEAFVRRAFRETPHRVASVELSVRRCGTAGLPPGTFRCIVRIRLESAETVRAEGQDCTDMLAIQQAIEQARALLDYRTGQE